MTTISEHARSLLAYNEWADVRLLDAARALDGERFGAISERLSHALGTQRWWLSLWTGGTHEAAAPATYEDMRAAYAASHEALRAYAERLDDAEWDRSEQWWKEWGYEQSAPAGEMISQVVLHGVQHRSEVAEQLTAFGHSPGELDYLRFLAEQQGVSSPD